MGRVKISMTIVTRTTRLLISLYSRLTLNQDLRKDNIVGMFRDLIVTVRYISVGNRQFVILLLGIAIAKKISYT